MAPQHNRKLVISVVLMVTGAVAVLPRMWHSYHDGSFGALREQGHEVQLMPAQFVRSFVKSNKNDYRDAEAIAEAVERENMRFVPIKTEDQLDVQALHRVRERLVSR